MKTYRPSAITAGMLCVAALLYGVAARADTLPGDIHGFVSQGYIKTTKENSFPIGNSGQSGGSFSFNDFGINYIKQLQPDLRVGIQLFAQDRGTYGNDRVVIDWAYGDYHYRDWLGVRAGKVKIPHGLYNTSRDNDALRNSILLPQGIYSEYYRDLSNAMLGAGIYGNVRGAFGKLAYELYLGTMPFTKDSAIAEALGASAASSGSSHSIGLVWETPIDGLRLSATGVWSKATGTSMWTPGAPPTNWAMDPWHRAVYSVEYVRDNLTLAAEYGTEDFDAAFGPGVPVQPWRGGSWYVSAAYRFTDWLEVGAYHNRDCADRAHCDGSTFADFGMVDPANMYQNDSALTLRFDVRRDLVVKLEGHVLQGNALNWLQSPIDQVKDWSLFAVKATYNF